MYQMTPLHLTLLAAPKVEGVEINQLVLPTQLQNQMLITIHDAAGHQGSERTLALVKMRCYWPRMSLIYRDGVTSANVVAWLKTSNQSCRHTWVAS